MPITPEHFRRWQNGRDQGWADPATHARWRQAMTAANQRRAAREREIQRLLAADPELAALSPRRAARYLALRQSGQSRADALREATRCP